jgi:hypothetical protein
VSRWRPEARVLLLPDDVAPADAALAFARQVEQQALPRGTRLACVVPVPLVRYVLVPWTTALRGRRTRQVLAEHCLRETYGDLVRDWTVRVDAAGFGSPALACAMSSALLADLDRVATAQGVVLASVQPALMSAFNALKAPLADGSTWIVVPGRDALTLLLVDDGRPLRVAVVAGTVDQLDVLLRREWFALGREGRWSHVRVCAPAPAGAHATPASSTPLPVALAA